jgi:glycosyltransferase involved in cell wall biosynthesis
MKTLFIGHYKEGSGWSNAAINTILSMNSIDMDLVCRNIKLTNTNISNLDHRIMMLENKSLKNIDVCIQNVLPHHIVGTQKFKKNIAYFVGESNTLKYNKWLYHLKLVDEVWVPNQALKESLENDGLANVVKIPYAFNIEQYKTKAPGRIRFDNFDHFKFYYIGELNDRKNIESIIRCFYSEFQRYEPVSLILKIKKFGINSNDLRNHVQNICNTIKKELRIYQNIEDYNREIIITEDFSEDQIKALHLSCDCFVSPTHGEGWSIPAFEAMCYGKTPICSNEGGPKEYIDPNNKNTGWLVNGVNDVCNHSDPAFPDIFTGREEWFHPSESEIKKAMRFYYENRVSSKDGILSGERFSYENVGQIIKDHINA